MKKNQIFVPFVHNLLANSTTKVEYIVALGATKKDVWMKKFIIELDVILSIAGSIDLYCDNNGVITRARVYKGKNI